MAIKSFMTLDQVEERTETLIYDLVGVLAAAGGHLGLCLGFSCLTLVLTILEWIELKVWKSLRSA